MAAITTFRDLKVYQRARAEAQRIFALSMRFPRAELYSLTDQVRRSSRAVAAMIGEAWARRRYEAVFVSKMSEALGEAIETRVWLDHSFDCGYVNKDEHEAIDGSWSEIAAMLHTVIEKAPAFCHAQRRAST